MTPPVNDPETLRRILANTEALLLDFDGPICSVFSGIPPAVVADQLRDVLADGGHTDLPEDVRTAEDPFDVLFYAAKLGQDEAHYVEAAFRAHEVEAVQTAGATPASIDLIQAWKANDRPLAIVSNNSIAAVETYLEINALRHDINIVSARTGPDVTLLKPNPPLVTSAVGGLGVLPNVSTLVGDSPTDIEAAHAADVQGIGFANKAGKAARFDATEPAAIITSLSVLVDAISRT